MWRLLDCPIPISPVVDTACIQYLILDIGMIDAPNCMRLRQLEGTFEHCQHNFLNMEISLMTWSGNVKSPDDQLRSYLV